MTSAHSDYLVALGIAQYVARDTSQLPDVAGSEQQAAPSAPATVVTDAATPPRVASADVASLDWPQLRERVAACTQCSLASSRTQTVFGTGDINAQWLIVGEAPGAEEDKHGEPFIGRAGQLLNAMLQAAGRPRESVFIANILKCRPPNNRDPKKDEVHACSGYLDRQIALLKPQLILAVGRISAQRLLATDATLGSMRSKVHHYGDENPVPVVVTYHPAYLLRSPSYKRKAWEDLLFAHQVAGGHVH